MKHRRDRTARGIGLCLALLLPALLATPAAGFDGGKGAEAVFGLAPTQLATNYSVQEISCSAPAKGFVDVAIKPATPKRFGAYALVLDLPGQGRQFAAAFLLTPKATPGKVQHPTYALDLREPTPEMCSLWQRLGIKGTRTTKTFRNGAAPSPASSAGPRGRSMPWSSGTSHGKAPPSPAGAPTCPAMQARDMTARLDKQPAVEITLANILNYPEVAIEVQKDKDGNTRIMECALPWSEIPDVKAALDAGRHIKFSFRVTDDKGPTYELAAGRSVSKQNPLAFHAYWETHWANEVEFGFEK